MNEYVFNEDENQSSVPVQIDSFTRRYYKEELSAGVGPSLSGTEQLAIPKPFRSFAQNETFCFGLDGSREDRTALIAFLKTLRLQKDPLVPKGENSL